MAPHPRHPPSLFRPFSRRGLMKGLAATAASSALSGCGIALVRSASTPTGALPTPPQPIPQPVPLGTTTAVSLTIAATPAGSLDPGFLGLAYEKQSLLTPLFTTANKPLVGLFRRLGPGVLRLGGPSADQATWTPAGPGQTPGQIAPPDVDALAAFLRATGWSCLYALNLGGSATGATTPALAAAEAACVTHQLGPALLALELGNQCETYGTTFYPGNWSVELFEALWQQYRSAIVAITPTAPLAGPAAVSNLDTWTLPFAEYVTSTQLSLLTQHLTPNSALATELLTLHYGAQSIGIPFRLDGLTSFDSGGAPGISNTYASALWALDTTFQTALAGASGLNFNSGSQTLDAVITDANGTVLGPRPAFYGLLLASLAGNGTLLATQLSAGTLNVSAYALQCPTGSLSLVLLNLDATQNLDVSILVPNAMSSASLLQLTQLSPRATTPSLTALDGITLQGATIATDGTFLPDPAYTLPVNGPQLSCYVPALSAVLLQLT